MLKVYLDETQGKAEHLTDIPRIPNTSSERYDTKPLKLSH